MKKLLSLLMIAIALFSFVSCSSTNNIEKASDDDAWWNSITDTEEFHFEIGMAKSFDKIIARNWAKSDADKNIASYIRNKVGVITLTMSSEGGEYFEDGVNTQVLKNFQQASKQIANESLTGVTYKYHTEPDGTVYVLASIEKSNLTQKIHENVEKFAVNESTQLSEGKTLELIKMIVDEETKTN